MSQVFWLNSPVVLICNSATASHMNGMKNEEGEKNWKISKNLILTRL